MRLRSVSHDVAAQRNRLRGNRLTWALVFLSLLLWSSWYVLDGPTNPYGDLSNGVYTDHFSHMNTARLFPSAGINIWREPLDDLVHLLSPAQYAALPADVQAAGQQYRIGTVPGWPADKPFVASWSRYPRLHPPGDMVLTAPVAVLYQLTDISFSTANRLLILSFLVFAHLSLFLLLQSAPSIDRLRPIGLLVLFIAYLEVIHWTLEGFYEATLIAPLILCARYLAQRRGLAAMLMFSIAADLHFRSYFFAPLAIYAAWIVLRDRQWRTWRRLDWGLASVAAVLSLVSLGVFGLVWPWVSTQSINNPVSIMNPHDSASTTAVFVVVWVAMVGVFAYSKSWLDLAVVTWVGLMLLLARQAWSWDVVTLLAWLAMPIWKSVARLDLVRDARIITIAFFGIYVFGNTTLLAPTWLQHVLR